jgi:hypothetical protein
VVSVKRILNVNSIIDYNNSLETIQKFFYIDKNKYNKIKNEINELINKK